KGLENLPGRNEKEKKLAKAKGFEDEIRLACQTVPSSDIKIRRLVNDTEDMQSAVAEHGNTSGREAKLAVLFSDIRGYTSFSEKALPYDAVHILNRYFARMGDSVRANRGFIDKYIGDGMMVLFGLNGETPYMAASAAVRTAVSMVNSLNELNIYLKKNFDTKFQIGIGIHYGNLIVGEIGHSSKRQFTAIGDSVNFASRIESYTKQAGVPILVSESVYNIMKNDVKIYGSHKAELKGKEGTHILYGIRGIRKQNSSNVCSLFSEFIYDKISPLEAPSLFRMAFHDASTFNPETGKGGFRGYIFDLKALALPEHEAFRKTAENLLKYRKEFEEERKMRISLPDLLYGACSAALQKCEGPELPSRYGRKEADYCEGLSVPPDSKISYENLVGLFRAMNLSVQEMTALSGAHTLGKSNGKSFTDNPFVFDTDYFKNLLLSENEETEYGFLPTDFMLLKNPESRKWVIRYAFDRNLFFSDFS
ncbi:MAG TPA: adenylate/guanylate cyclase domain-containing protein, partial [Leptospiraceae bacterium]|nr:adenylate/guanylate cyclase domain-containing protein [Leptospiraceae bacterium]